MKTRKLLCLLLVPLIIAASLAGCSGKSPEDTVSGALETVKNRILSETKDYFTNNLAVTVTFSDNMPDDIDKAMTSNMTFEVKSVETSGKTGTAQLSITNFNLEKVLDDYLAYLMSSVSPSGDSVAENEPEASFEYLRSMLKTDNSDYYPVTTDITVKLVKDKNWKIEMSDELYKAMHGGLSYETAFDRTGAINYYLDMIISIRVKTSQN